MIDARETIAGLQKLDHDVRVNAKQALGQAASVAVQTARATSLFRDRTGALRGSIRRFQRGEWHWIVTAGGKGARYGYFVESGTRAHVIRPKKPGGVLRFVVAGEVMFRRSVNHPGTKPRPFMRAAREASASMLFHVIESGVRNAIG